MNDFESKTKPGFWMPEVREFLRWCLPGIVVAIVLRGLLAWHLPHAYLQGDSLKYLFTGSAWSEDESSDFGENITFLTPALYAIPIRLGIPALAAIQVMQHLQGLTLVLAAGALCRWWFRHWKVFIVPITLIFAAHPALLWFEHTLMAEIQYVFWVVWLAVAGTFFAKRPGWLSCSLLSVALFFTAASRPEGKLFAIFGVALLVLLVLRDGKLIFRYAALLVPAAIISWELNQTHESGVLLYSSVLHLSPETSRSVPGIEPYVRDLRDQMRREAAGGPAFVSRELRRTLVDKVKQFVEENPTWKKTGDLQRDADAVCKKLAMETCFTALPQLPVLALNKFRSSATDMPNGLFDEHWLVPRQIGRLKAHWSLFEGHCAAFYGTRLDSFEELKAFIAQKYPADKVTWFQVLMKRWRATFLDLRLADARYGEEKLRGIPWIFLTAAAGMIAACLPRSHARFFHWAWVPMLLGLFLIVMLTANERARYRLVFEPFTYIYALLLLDTIAGYVRALLERFSIAPGTRRD